MALNSQYVIAPSLEMYFVDKDTGLPLDGGIVTFYQDEARTIKKNVYKLSGSPPNYSYDVLPNPCILSGVGTFIDDNGNDIIPYYFPYNDEDNTIIELYYITVEDKNNILQFTREGWPNITGTTITSVEETINFVPNPQFLLHNDLPATDTLVAGEIRASITYIAQGGWTFERSPESTAKDIVVFTPLSFTANPPGNPSFYVNIKNEGVSSDDTKDLRIKFINVNKFASPSDTPQDFTFAFSSEIASGNGISIDLYLIKNYGDGGSTTDEIFLETFSITDNWTFYQKSFTFGDNSGKSIGPNSNVQLAIRLPLGSIFDVSFTDFILTINDTQLITQFPPTTDADMLTRSLPGWLPTPNPDGSDLYLPIRLTLSGMEFDSSQIGKVEGVLYNTPKIGQLIADGSKYDPISYSDDGIPFSRLWNILYDSILNVPIYGTGLDYFTAFPGNATLGTGVELLISNNSQGFVANASDGTATTGFVFSTIHSGSTLHTTACMIESNTFFLQNKLYGVAELTSGEGDYAAAGTSGFTVEIENPVRHTSTIPPGIYSTRARANITTISATTLAGKYFQFNDTLTNFYVWFQVNGSGSDPSPGGTGILVKLNTSDSQDLVAQKIQISLNGFQETSIEIHAATTITSGDYFNIYSTGSQYFVWYSKDGTGTKPIIPGGVEIKVNIQGGFTSEQVSTETLKSINKKFFAVPDFRGMFFRGLDLSSLNDPDSATRYSLVPGIIGDRLGTSELCEIQSHIHRGIFDEDHSDIDFYVKKSGGSGGGSGEISPGESNTTYTGGFETRPVNTNVLWIINY